MSEAQIVVGKISGVFGVQGWLKIHAYTDPLDNILSHQPWLLKLRENITEMRIEAGRQQGKSIIARFPGCSTREQAEQWIGAEISVLRSCLPALQGREYYWIDLLGCEVSTAQGE